MALALDYLHNKHDSFGYVHNDIKPDNILVDLPNGWRLEDGIPDEPIFKLTDFVRMTAYPPPKGAKPSDYFLGTPEYAPPLSEQKDPRPSADIWALGATLQTFALSLFPTQSRESFADHQRKARKHAPILIDDSAWKKSCWRHLIPTIYRPLSATQDELVADFDVRASGHTCGVDAYSEWEHRPYSKALNGWYRSMWDEDKEKRITAKLLVTYCVPRVAREIRVARNTENALECFERAKELRREVEGRRQRRVAEAEGVAFELLDAPSYDGSDYGAIVSR